MLYSVLWMHACAVPVIIVTTQWALPCKAWQVKVIPNDHDVTKIEVLISSTCCVCHNQSFHAQKGEDPHWVCHLEQQTWSEESRTVCRSFIALVCVRKSQMTLVRCFTWEQQKKRGIT